MVRPEREAMLRKIERGGFAAILPGYAGPFVVKPVHGRASLHVEIAGTRGRVRSSTPPLAAESSARSFARSAHLASPSSSTALPRMSCSLTERAREWALERGAGDPAFRAELETIASLADAEHARAKMADYVMELWTPDDEPRGQKKEST